MKTILSNVSAMYWYDGIPVLRELNSSRILRGSLICGTNDGTLYVYRPYSGSLENIYQFASQEPIYQIAANTYYIVVLLEDGSVYRFFNGNSKRKVRGRYQLFSYGPKLIGTNVGHLFSPYTMLMNDSAAFGLYDEGQDTIVQIRNLEYFEGDNIFDQSCACLAINRFMSTASVYTLNLSDYATWKKDTFSYEGEFMSKVAETIQDSHSFSDDNKNMEGANIFLDDMFDFEDEMVEQEEIMNSLLPKSMVRSVHDKRTYLDFVKLYNSRDKDNPFVVTGGRDHRIIITDFVSHKVFFDETFESIPRCCCDSKEKIYVGCDDGTIVIINKSDYDYKVISVGDKMFKRIETNYKGEYVVAVNSDDVVFCIDTEIMEPVRGIKIDDIIKDVVKDSWHPSVERIYVLTGAGDLLQMEV